MPITKIEPDAVTRDTIEAAGQRWQIVTVRFAGTYKRQQATYEVNFAEGLGPLDVGKHRFSRISPDEEERADALKKATRMLDKRDRKLFSRPPGRWSGVPEATLPFDLRAGCDNCRWTAGEHKSTTDNLGPRGLCPPWDWPNFPKGGDPWGPRDEWLRFAIETAVAARELFDQAPGTTYRPR